jgi:hypothetical protein
MGDEGIMEYLKMLEEIVGAFNSIGKHKAKLFAGVKRTNYWMPVLIIGSTDTFCNKNTLYVEIFIDDLCVWREAKYKPEEKTFEKDKEILAQRILISIAMFGMFDNYKNTIQIRNQAHSGL